MYRMKIVDRFNLKGTKTFREKVANYNEKIKARNQNPSAYNVPAPERVPIALPKDETGFIKEPYVPSASFKNKKKRPGRRQI